MSQLAEQIRALVKAGDVLISGHGYDELAEDGLSAREVLDGIEEGMVVEEYPDYPKGACVLVLQKDKQGSPVHVVWGIPKGHDRPAVLVTAYRPDPERWNEDFTKRQQ